MKITEKIKQCEQKDRVWWSFEYFPPRTAQVCLSFGYPLYNRTHRLLFKGLQNLLDRIERMRGLGPEFIDITWYVLCCQTPSLLTQFRNAGGRTSDLTAEMVKTCQGIIGIETCMHLTCTNMPKEKVDIALRVSILHLTFYSTYFTFIPTRRKPKSLGVATSSLYEVTPRLARRSGKPLKADSYMSSVALEHSRNMLSGKVPFGHEGFRERVDRIKKKMGPLHVAAENVASGPMGAREVVDGWLHSPGHRRNIEGDFRLTGIGLAFGKRGMIYFTQIFAR